MAMIIASTQMITGPFELDNGMNEFESLDGMN
jgi:hypothetical protein